MSLTAGQLASILGAGMEAVDGMPPAPHTLALGRMLDAMCQRAREFDQTRTAEDMGTHPADAPQTAKWYRQMPGQWPPFSLEHLIQKHGHRDLIREILSRLPENERGPLVSQVISDIASDMIRVALFEAEAGRASELIPDSPCPVWSKGIAHQSHGFLTAQDGFALCPGLAPSEPDVEPDVEPEATKPEPKHAESVCGDAAAGREHGPHTWRAYDDRTYMCNGLPAGDR